MSGWSEFMSMVSEGWVITLLHSLWQGALMAGLVYLILWVFDIRTPKYRYLTGLIGMCLFILVVGITFMTVIPSAPSATVPPADDAISITYILTEGTEIPALPQRIVEVIKTQMPLILKIWSVGVVLLLVRILGGYQYLLSLTRRGDETVPDSWKQMIKRISNKMNIRQSVRVLHSRNVDMPMVYGHLKPVMLLPVTLLSGLSTEQLEAIFAHELAHIRRHDYLINVGQQMVEAFFFFNPFVWLISGFLRDEREKCCDDLAVEFSHNRKEYVRALSALETYRIGYASGALMLIGNKKALLDRVRRLMDPSYGDVGSSRWIVMILLSATFLSFSYFTQSPKTTEVEEIVEATPVLLSQSVNKVIKADTLPPKKSPAPPPEIVEVVDSGSVFFKSFTEPFEFLVMPEGSFKVFEFPDSLMEMPFIIEVPEFPELKIIEMDMNSFFSDTTGSYTYVWRNDTVPYTIYRDSTRQLSKEDREMMARAREEMRRAQETMREEQKRMREIMRKYNERRPEIQKEMQQAMRRYQEERSEHQQQWRAAAKVHGSHQLEMAEIQKKLQEELERAELSKEEMENIQEIMREAQQNMKRISPEVRAYSYSYSSGNGMDEFRNEIMEMLKDDGYLKEGDNLKKLEFTKDSFSYNGKKVKSKDVQKYLDSFYNSQFGGKERPDIKMEFNED